MKHKQLISAVAVTASLCVLFAVGKTSASGPSSQTVTFTKDVAPIFYEHCAVCHRPGTIAPMSLLTYKDARPWARSIQQAVLGKTMPPWHASPKYGDFVNDRHLSDNDISIINKWVEQGVKEGNPKDMPRMPKFDTDGWVIGKPDVVLSMTEEASVPAEGTVAYRYFVVPTNFDQDQYITAAEIHRGNPAVVHHVIINVVEPGGGQLPPAGELKFDPEGRSNEGDSGPRGRRNRNPDGMLVGWAPGMSPLVLRPRQAKLIKKGSVLVFQMHYTTNGKSGTDRTSVGLKFAKGPVEKRVITTGAFSRMLDIPPGDANYETHATYTFKEDSHILSFMPHMHLRGKDFTYTLVYPDGTSKVLLDVPHYDFSWQTTYIFREAVAAPKGSRLECVAHFDNSDKNKFNPDPTKRVRWGQQTWDEMMIGWMDLTLDGQNLRQETASLR